MGASWIISVAPTTAVAAWGVTVMVGVARPGWLAVVEEVEVVEAQWCI